MYHNSERRWILSLITPNILMKFLVYSIISTSAIGAQFYYEYQKYGQYYPAFHSILSASTSLWIFYNFLLMIFIFSALLFFKLFVGTIRPIELQHLYENGWYLVMESLLVISFFRTYFSFFILQSFVALVFIKVFHWISSDRVELIEQSPFHPKLFHIRLVSLLTIIGAFDAYFILDSYSSFIKQKKTYSIFLGFEFFLLFLSWVMITYRYVLSMIDSCSEEHWEKKSVYIFYMELVVEFIKLIAYCIFFYVVLHHYGIPIHILRDLYITFLSLSKRIKDVIQYNRATINMNEKYPDASQDELSEGDNICIVCREEMISAKKLPCGHILHLHCLRSWLERQQSCPTCRVSVFSKAKETTQKVRPISTLSEDQLEKMKKHMKEFFCPQLKSLDTEETTSSSIITDSRKGNISNIEELEARIEKHASTAQSLNKETLSLLQDCIAIIKKSNSKDNDNC